MTRRPMAVLVSLAALLVVEPAWAERDEEGPAGWVRYEKGIEIPARGAESIEIVNRLGKILVLAWDRPSVAVSATKQAPSAALGERLRVEVSSSSGQRITVRTYVRLRPAIPPTLSRALRELMRRQKTALGRLAGRSVAKADKRLRRELTSIQGELEQLGQRYAAAVAAGAPSPASNHDVPVADGRLDLRVQVPRALQVRARTFDGQVAIDGCQGGVDASSEEGEVVVQRAKGKVVTWTQKGAQRLEQVKGPVEVGGGEANVVLRRISGPVRAMLVAGAIDARQLGALVATLKTVRGSLRVDGVPRGGRYSLVSRGGDVIVHLTPKDGFRLRGRAARFEPDDLGGALRRLKHVGDRVEGAWRRGGLLDVATRRGALKLVSE